MLVIFFKRKYIVKTILHFLLLFNNLSSTKVMFYYFSAGLWLKLLSILLLNKGTETSHSWFQFHSFIVNGFLFVFQQCGILHFILHIAVQDLAILHSIYIRENFMKNLLFEDLLKANISMCKEYLMKHDVKNKVASFGSTCTKVVMIQRRFSWIQAKMAYKLMMHPIFFEGSMT